MQRLVLVLAGALVAAVLSPAPAAAAVRSGAPYVRFVGPVHTTFLLIKVFCPVGTTAEVQFGLVAQPHDPDFRGPLNDPDPTNLALVVGRPVPLPCAGKERLVRLALAPVECGDDPSCVALPGLVRGVRADVVLDIEFDGDLSDFPAIDVRVV